MEVGRTGGRDGGREIMEGGWSKGRERMEEREGQVGGVSWRERMERRLKDVEERRE